MPSNGSHRPSTDARHICTPQRMHCGRRVRCTHCILPPSILTGFLAASSTYSSPNPPQLSPLPAPRSRTALPAFAPPSACRTALSVVHTCLPVFSCPTLSRSSSAGRLLAAPPWAYIIPICILFAGRWVLLLCVWPPASVASLPREKEQAQRVAPAASLFHRLFIRRVLPCSVLCPRLKEPLAQLVSFSRAPSD